MLDVEEEIGLAEAVFDNDAEWPDELVFRKGEILRVLDQQPAGGLAEGWWLCADKRGRRGIAPANRLKMIRTFGPGRNRVITPRRLGDVFVYNQRMFDDDPFAQQPLFSSLFDSSYDVPSTLRNIHLLHGSEHPFLLGSTMTSNGSSDTYDTLRDRNSDGISRQPIVRNVPIKVEMRNSSEATATGRNRSPPPPPQRRHFSMSAPLMLSSLTAPPTTSSASGSDEERIGLDAAIGFSPKIDELMGRLSPSRSHPIVTTTNVSRTYYESPTSLPTVGNSSKLADDGLKSVVHQTHLQQQPLQQIDKDQTTNSTTNNATSEFGRQTFQQHQVAGSGNADANDTGRWYDVPRRLRNETAMTTLTLAKPTRTDGYRLVRNGVDQTRNGGDTSSALTGAMTTDFFRAGSSSDAHRSADELSENGHHVYATPIGKRSVQKASSSSPETANSGNGEAEMERLSISSMDSKGSDYQELLGGGELRLTAAAALETLTKLLENLRASVEKLSGHVTRNWRRREYLESRISDIRLACRHMMAALKDFVDFSSGAFVNVNQPAVASTASDVRLRLAHLVRPLKDSWRLLLKLQQTLDASGWTAGKFARDGAGSDSLDQFVAVAKQVPEDARQVATFIQGSVSLIFPPPSSLVSGAQTPSRSRSGAVSPSISSSITSASSTTTPTGQQPTRSVRFAEDVQMSTGEVAPINGDPPLQRHNRSITNGAKENASEKTSHNGVSDTRNSVFDDYDFVGGDDGDDDSDVDNDQPDSVKLPASATTTATTAADKLSASNHGLSISDEDKQIVQFYLPQVDNHIECLSNAIDEFLAAVEQNQPPKVFVGHSKFVILGAHKLVYIGDSVSQCLRDKNVADKVKLCSDRLCDVLKFSVAATKQAALQFPSVPCVQAMVDSMVGVSHAAYELKLLIREAANLQ